MTDGKKSTYLIQYNLQGGNDKLEITGSLQEALKSIFITGSSGNDYLSGITMADGGDGDDEIITFSTSNRNYAYQRDGLQQYQLG